MSTCADHNDTALGMPVNYLGRSLWYEETVKTHTQHRCDECGLWRIWIPKKAA